MLKTIALIGLGGGIGSVLRYLINYYIESLEWRSTPPESFPYGTLFVNVTGCFLVGLVFVLSGKYNFHHSLMLFLATGLCGGYTTFSAFSIQSITLLRAGHLTQALTYIFASVILGLLATLIPIVVMQK